MTALSPSRQRNDRSRSGGTPLAVGFRVAGYDHIPADRQASVGCLSSRLSRCLTHTLCTTGGGLNRSRLFSHSFARRAPPLLSDRRVGMTLIGRPATNSLRDLNSGALAFNIGHHVRQDKFDVPKTHVLVAFPESRSNDRDPSERQNGRVPNSKANLPNSRGEFPNVA